MPTIQEYTVSELEQWCCSEKRWSVQPLPITPQRALSHLKNPRAESADLALLVAYDDGKVVGHLGILPDKLFIGADERKIGWLTAWWVDPGQKYRGLGLILLMRAKSRYRGSLGASGFSDDSKRVFSATRQFVTVREAKGLSLYCRISASDVISKRYPKLANVTMPLRPIDFAADQLATCRQTLWRRRHQWTNGFVIDYCVELDHEVDNYLERHQTKQLTRRGVRELNWIYRYPWYSGGPLAPALPYRFSTKAKSYHCFLIKLYDPARSLVAVIMFMAINGHLTIPYCWYDCDVNLIAQLVMQHIVALRLNGVTTYRSDLIDRLSASGFPWVWRINRTRAWVVSDISRTADLSEYIVQDGDGDLAFTL